MADIMKVPGVKKGMTGDAYNMTIPQLKKAVATLKDKLKDSNVKNNQTIIDKINKRIHDYTKAENEILKTWKILKQHYPNILSAKKNTMTLLQMYKKLGVEADTLNNLRNKKQPLAYGIADFAKDTKGLALGVACTSIGLGVANQIALAATSNEMGIFAVVGDAIGQAFKTSPVTSSLIAAGLAIGGAALIIPKVSRAVNKIKNNATAAREMQNETLIENDKGELDFTTDSEEVIKEKLKGDDELRQAIVSGNFDFDGFTQRERNLLRKAAFTADNELNLESRKVRIDIGRQKQINEADRLLEEFAHLESIDIMSEAELATLKAEIDSLATTPLSDADKAKLAQLRTEYNTAKSNVSQAERDYNAAENEFNNKNNAFNDAETAYNQADAERIQLDTDVTNMWNNDIATDNVSTSTNASTVAAATAYCSNKMELEQVNKQIETIDNKLSTAIGAERNTLTSQKTTLESRKNSLKRILTTDLSTLKTAHGNDAEVAIFVSKVDTYAKLYASLKSQESICADLEAAKNAAETAKDTAETAKKDAEKALKNAKKELKKYTEPGSELQALIANKTKYETESATKTQKQTTYDREKGNADRKKQIHDRLLAIYGTEDAIKEALKEVEMASMGD